MEKQKLLCDDSKKQEQQLLRNTRARNGYEADKALSEADRNNLTRDTLYFSLDLQKVRMMPEIEGLKSAMLCYEGVHS